MVKMGRLVQDQLGIAHFGCADHRLEKTAQRFYKHAGVEASLLRAKAVVTFIHKSSQVTGSGDHAHAFVRVLCWSCCIVRVLCICARVVFVALTVSCCSAKTDYARRAPPFNWTTKSSKTMSRHAGVCVL
jgi:hypothetical protein